ncbi:MAG: GntR family transcriptional regulator [Thermoanaerobaculum sp.]
MATAPVYVVQRLQLFQQVADLLRREILDGKLAAGTWLRQDHLAKRFGVSAIPVREALKSLAAEGLVEHVPYRGIRVVRLSAEELEDLYEVRAFVEAKAAAYAAQRMTEGELGELERLCREMDACTSEETLPRYRELNRTFHMRIVELSRRPYLVRLVQQLWAAFPTMLWSNYPQVAQHSLPSREATDSAEHAAIVAALRRRDGRAAARAMENHVRRAGEELVRFVRQQGLPQTQEVALAEQGQRPQAPSEKPVRERRRPP